MELYWVNYESDKEKSMKNGWSNVVVLVGLLLALNVAAFLTELSQDTMRRSGEECLITLGIKFLNFCIAKAVQFRFAHPLETRPSFMPLLFWFTLARCILDCLCICWLRKMYS